MKVLLDENIDVRFKSSLNNIHEVFTVNDMGWNGIKNGRLLILLKEKNFDAWIVVDKIIPYQQNISRLSCLIIILDVYRNTIKHLLPYAPKILETLQKEITGKVVVLSNLKNK